MGSHPVKNYTGLDSKLLAPFGLAGAGALGTMVAGWSAWGWYTVLWSALLLAGAAWCARASGWGGSGSGGEADMIDNYLAGRQQFGDTVLPIWCRHIENSRSQMEEAVADNEP